MKARPYSALFLVLCLVMMDGGITLGAGGITPEQIYQSSIDSTKLIGTWEILSDLNPLSENGQGKESGTGRILMTFRKDGTCRIINKEHPLGADGSWTFEDHEISITLHNKTRIDMYVYGIKADFMITLFPVKNGQDQLWSRVK